MTLADMSVITAEVKVDETDIVNIQIGQPADVTVDALPGKVFKGHVTLVGDQALLRSTGVATSQSTTGTEEAKDFKVVVTLDNPSNELRPGLSTTAKITTAHKSDVLSLPIQALTMHNPDDDKPKGGVQAASTSIRLPRAHPCRASMWWTRTRAASCAPSSSPSPPASPGPPTSKCSPGSTEGQEIVTGPYKTLRVLKEQRAGQARHRQAGCAGRELLLVIPLLYIERTLLARASSIIARFTPGSAIAHDRPGKG